MARPRTISDAEITEAARRVFFRDGPNAPLTAIAGELGVSAAAIVKRVGGKENLLGRVLCHELPTEIESLFARPLPERSGLDTELVHILIQVLAVFRNVVPSLVVAHTAGSLPGASQSGRGLPHRTLRRLLTAWLRRTADVGQRLAAEPKLLSELMISAIEARCFNDFIAGEQPGTRSDRRFLRRLVNGSLPGGGPHE